MVKNPELRQIPRLIFYDPRVAVGALLEKSCLSNVNLFSEFYCYTYITQSQNYKIGERIGARAAYTYAHIHARSRAFTHAARHTGICSYMLQLSCDPYIFLGYGIYLP